MPDIEALIGSKIGTFVEVQKNAHIGRHCKISSHTFICEGVVIEDDCFVGHHVCFTNDLLPRATTGTGACWNYSGRASISRRSDRR